MFDDKVPEEQEEQQKKLIPLLQRWLREPLVISPHEQSQIIDRVRGRLMQTDNLSSRAGNRQPARARTRTMRRLSAKGERILRFGSILAAVLVVSILIGASLLLFRFSPGQNTTGTSIGKTGPAVKVQANGPTAHAQANGLDALVHLVTPGPYFLREFLAVDVSLTNHTQKPVELGGSNKPDTPCVGSALDVKVTSGSAPLYTLPTLDLACTAQGSVITLAPGQTLTIHQYLPMTKSGDVTVTMVVWIDIPGGGTSLPTAHWPFLSIHVDPLVPSNLALSLQAQGTQVTVQAPPDARPHLLSIESIACDSYPGEAPVWTPLLTTTLSEPACPTANKHWKYIITAPGYAIVSGTRDT